MSTGSRAAVPAAPLSKKGERTKARVRDAAFRLFGERGYAAVSLRDIGAEAGITHVTVLHYFPSKDELLVDLMVSRDRVEREAAEEFFRSHEDDEERWRGVGSPALRWFLLRLERNDLEPGATPLFLRVAAEATEVGHPAHEHFVRRYSLVQAMLRDALSVELAGRSAGAPAVSPRDAANHLIAIADGAMFREAYMEDESTAADAAWEYLRILGIADPAE